MQYTEIAGRKVSAMSLGTVQLGMNYGIANQEGKPDLEKSLSILRAAMDAGVSALDTARNYGDSEEVLGAFFRANPGANEIFFITTKLSTGLPEGSPEADVEKAVMQSVELSLRNLGLSKVDCILLHNAADMKAHGQIMAQTMRRIVDEGLCGMAGVSVYHPEEAELLLQYDIYRAIQLPMNVFDLRFQKSGVMERLQQSDIHIFVRSVFFQGLIFLDPENISGNLKFMAPYLRQLRQLSEKAGMTIAQFAVTFLSGLPGMASLVLGADNPGQVKENSALFEAPPLKDEIRHEAELAFSDIDYAAVMAELSRPRQ